MPDGAPTWSPTPPSEPPEVARASERALVALVCGVVGMMAFQPVGVGAIVLGRRARRELPDGHPRRVMAIVGEILGWVAILLLVALVALLVVFLF